MTNDSHLSPTPILVTDPYTFFTVRDLRERTDELIRDAESGELSVITKRGRPVYVALPFDKTLIKG